MELKPVTISVDGVAVAAKPGQNLLEVCLAAKRELPYFCWHPALGSVGSCRQCAVTVHRDDGASEIVMACMTPVSNGMSVAIADPAAIRFREAVVEAVLTNHPHDCPVCEVGGECHLQDMATLTGHAHRRYRFSKRTHRNQDLGPLIRHEMNRCIGCYRCVRFYRDYAGGDDFGVFGAHRNVYFGRAEDGPLESPFAGNLVEVCPTGVFVDKPFSTRFRRKWDMRATPSVCAHCAVGCAITINEREGQFRRVVNRFNPNVNGHFLCDRGRFGAAFVSSPARLRTTRLLSPNGRDERFAPAEAVGPLAALLRLPGVIGIGSPRASLEANFALRRLVGESHFHAGLSSEDSSTLTAAVAILQHGGAPTASLAEVEQADAILILGQNPSEIAPRLALALRQAVQRPSPERLAAGGIPAWHDSAARLLAAERPASLAVVSPLPTDFDSSACLIHRAAPAAVVGFAAAAARSIDTQAMGDNQTTPDPQVTALAALLSAAVAPVIVAGGSEALLLAAANIVMALRRAGTAARLSLLVPEANSIGLGLLDGRPLSEALDALADGRAAHAIVLENDLSRRAPRARLAAAFTRATTLCVLDTIETSTTEKADWVFAVAAGIESDGIYVNAEGRAQPFFKAIFGTDDAPPSWCLLRDAGIASGRLPSTAWPDRQALFRDLGQESPALAACIDILPPVDAAALRKPSLPHRYSGRTAVHAQLDVREAAPPSHPGSPFATTMEGMNGEATPLNWSPGWNSGQAVLRYQDEVGGETRDSIMGVRLFADTPNMDAYFEIPTLGPEAAGTQLIPRWRVFGSDELSNLSPPIQARTAAPSVALHPDDAGRLGLRAGAEALCGGDDAWLRRRVEIDDRLPRGVAAVDFGFPGDPFVAMPGSGNVIDAAGRSR